MYRIVNPLHHLTKAGLTTEGKVVLGTAGALTLFGAGKCVQACAKKVFPDDQKNQEVHQHSPSPKP